MSLVCWFVYLSLMSTLNAGLFCQPRVYANSTACQHLSNMCVMTLYTTTSAPASSPQTVCDYYSNYANGEQWSVVVIVLSSCGCIYNSCINSASQQAVCNYYMTSTGSAVLKNCT